MCEVKVFKREKDKETLLLTDVYLIEEAADGLRFATIFGEERVYKAVLESVSLVDNKVVISERK
ncbi:MAG: putative RNA-binding protein [Syntrophorhabdaceae bacterium PtaU1.Bin034]|jgi:predicted RNA-binding protein|nr:MAG: putative RNA-binding protein [Syntrophorhabdaceae bacterium PtaU1.Bin034]